MLFFLIHLHQNLYTEFMKKMILLLFIVLLTSCCKQTVTVYELTQEEKEVIPYLKNSIFKWQTNTGLILEGEVTEISETKDFDQSDCEEYYFEKKYANLKTDQYNYGVSITKKGTGEVDLLITIYHLDNSFTDLPQFIKSSNNLVFSTINFNNETFTNAIIIDAYDTNGNVKSTLIYSKTNGIEFILFEDGTWYKRVE